MRLWDIGKRWIEPPHAQKPPHYLDLVPDAPRLTNAYLIHLHHHFQPMEADLVERLNRIMTLRMYHQLPTAQRRETLNRIAGAFAEAFGFGPIPPVMIKSDASSFAYFGMYGQGRIILDPRGLGDLNEAVATTVHEAMHAYQRKIANEWLRGSAYMEPVLRPVAQAWAFNFNHYLSPAAVSMATYKSQPLEYHAYRVEARVCRAMPWLRDPQRPGTGSLVPDSEGPESASPAEAIDWQSEMLRENSF